MPDEDDALPDADVQPPPTDPAAAFAGFDTATYGERFADVYDDWYADITDVIACTSTLARLAGRRPVLELGVGTGRLAIPLAERGVEVVGVDSSSAMLERMAAKPGADRVEIIQGDMVDPPLAGRRFGLIYVAFNTFFNLPSADAQARCLTSVARLLDDESHFVLEGFVPPDTADGPDRTVAPSHMGIDRVVLTATIHDRHEQTITGQHIDITESGTRLRPWKIRYASPAQLDDMATAAGLELVERWAGWVHEPFDGDSPAHVSVYRPAPAASEPEYGS